MKKNIRKWDDFEKKKVRTFVRKTAEAVLPLLSAVLLISALSILILNTYVKDEIDRKNTETLSSHAGIIDSMIFDLEKMNIAFSTIPSVKVILKNCLLAIETNGIRSDDYETVTSIISVLFSSINYNGNIDSLYIYFNKDSGWFISSTNRFTNLNFYYDTDWMKSYEKMKSEKEQYWFESREISNFNFEQGNTVRTFTIFQKIFSSGKAEPDGVLVLNIREDTMNQYLGTLISTPYDTLAVLNSDGETVFSSSVKDNSPEMKMIRYSVNSELYGWKYVWETPESITYATPRMITGMIILIDAAVTVMEVIIALRGAGKNYHQIVDLVTLIEGARNGSIPPHNEVKNSDLLDHVVDHIIRLFIEQDYLKIQLSEKRYHAKTLELYALQSQLNPHFLYNTMQTILWKTIGLTKGPNEASKMIEDLSDILHYTLDDSNSIVPISEEFRITGSYLSILKQRLNGNLEYSWDFSNVDMSFRIPKLLFQPLIENTVIHGRRDNSSVISSTLSLHSDVNGMLFITVRDNGRGISEEALRKINDSLQSTEMDSSHIGLSNTAKRLNLIYGEKSLMKLESAEGKYT
ncbi:MAG: sensor histidine kinase, partial [Bullifex sp.]